MKNLNRKRVLVLVTTCSAVAIGGLMVAAGQPAKATKPRSGGSESASSELGVALVTSFDITTTATGELQAAKQIEIRNPLDEQTTITEIVKEGTRVSKGQLLIKLNTQSIEQRIAQERLDVESARAQLSVAENDVRIQQSDNDSSMRKAELDLEVSKLEYRQWLEGDVKSRRQELDLALERAQRELTRLKDKYDRAKSLAKEGFLSTDELKRDEIAYLEAEASLKTAELNKKVYEEIQFGKDQKIKESAVEQATANVERVKSNNASQLENRKAELNNRRESLKLREANLAKHQEQIASATIVAPSDGLVVHATSLERDRMGNSESALDVGKQVYPNQLLIVLPDTTEMVAAVRVHESLAGRIRAEQSATVKVDALGGKTLPGKVLSVGVLAESGGWRDPNLREYTVRIKLELGESGGVLKPSMRCEAEVMLERVPPVLSVPVQAVFSEGLVRYVLVPSGEQYTRKPVRIGRRSDRFVEISTGLVEGEQVLLRAPKPNELVERPWSDDELASVGLKKNPEGRVIPAGGMPSGAPGSGGGSRGQRPPTGAPAGKTEPAK